MYLFFAILGLVFGSFINVLVLRLKEEKTLLGRSACPKCSKVLSWFENIPVLSFIFLKARCRHCHQSISWQYPIVELASAVLWLGAYHYFIYMGVETVFIYGLYFSILLSLFIFDLKWYLLPDVITFSGIVVAIVFNLILGFGWWPMLLAGVLGASWFGAQYLVSKGKWVGAGDIFLGALIGLMVGSWEHLLLVILISYLSGSVVSIALLLTKKKSWNGQVPFGVFLTAATVVTLIWGSEFWSWYMGFLW